LRIRRPGQSRQGFDHNRVGMALASVGAVSDPGTKAAEIEAVITYHHRSGEELVVHRQVKKLTFR
jgi:hypothetical protein